MKKIKKYYLLIRGYVRCQIYIFCPKCNSDAPKKQDCNICIDFYGCPDQQRRNLWWYKFKLSLNQKEDKQ
jgi:hypothetical protein